MTSAVDGSNAFVELHRFPATTPGGKAIEVIDGAPIEIVDGKLSKSSKDWIEEVVSESRTAHSVFVRRDGDTWIVHDTSGESSELVAFVVPEIAQSLVHRRWASPGSRISLRWDESATQSFDAPQLASTPTVESVSTPSGLLSRLAIESDSALAALAEQLRSPLGLMPFIGAGMSAAFGLPQWGNFLHSAAKEVDGKAAPCDDGDYEALANRLWNHGSNWFQNKIRTAFDRTVLPDRLLASPIATLARLVDGPVITTNFDHVLEDGFKACDRPFDGVVKGVQVDSIVRALHQNQRQLLKIHGDCRERTDRVFTDWEYDRSYRNGGQDGTTLSSLGWLMFTQRPLLFLGCSLEKDRTVSVLADVQAKLKGINHFAVLAAKYRESKHLARSDELRSWGIVPLWFAPRDFARIDSYLERLVDLSSSKLLAPRATATAPSTPSRFRVPALAPASPSRSIPAATRAIARALLEGQVTVLLGSYSHFGALPTGGDFYRAMEKDFDAPRGLSDRSTMASYVVDTQGTPAVVRWYQRLLDSKNVNLSALNGLIAGLPRLLREFHREHEFPLTVFTTNYDTIFEQALVAADEPFHIFYYVSKDGRFVHRGVDGTTRLIERPNKFHAPRDAHTCVVKLSGGIPFDSATPHGISIASGDFGRLASLIPDGLPAGLRARVEGRSILCLGHGLNEPDVQQLIQWIQRTGEKRESWVVDIVPAKDSPDEAVQSSKIKYWERYGVKVIVQDLPAFTDDLREALCALE